MATGGEVRYSCCNSCLEDGSHTVAKHYCLNCEMYFCTKCLKCHKTIPALREHKVYDVINISPESTTHRDEAVQSEEETTVLSASSTLRCSIHRNKLINVYCKDHDEVFCSDCAVVKHRTCTTLSISIAAKDYKTSNEVQTRKEKLNKSLAECIAEKKKRADNCESIGEKKLELLEQVDEREKKVIERVKQLAEVSRKEIRSQYKESKTEIDSEIGSLDVVMTTLKDHIDSLEEVNEELLFVQDKTKQSFTKDSDLILETMKNEWCMKELYFDFDERLDDILGDMKSFGSVGGNGTGKTYKATLERNVLADTNARLANSAYVHGMCFMDSGDILLVDVCSTLLKRFESNFGYKDALKLPGNPNSICKTGANEVAIRMKRQVQFVLVGEPFHQISSFPLLKEGYGIAYDASTEELFVGEENKVCIYDKKGNKLRTYCKNMFSVCRQISLSQDGQDKYITDQNNGLFVLNKNASLKMKVDTPDIWDTWPLCFLPGHVCVVGSRATGVFVMIDKTGRCVGKLIDAKDGRDFAYCAVYDRKQPRLIVGGKPGVLSVYKITAE